MEQTYTKELKVLGGVWITADLEYGYLKNMASKKHILKRINVAIAYLSDQHSILQAQKEKAPDVDGTT